MQEGVLVDELRGPLVVVIVVATAVVRGDVYLHHLVLAVCTQTSRLHAEPMLWHCGVFEVVVMLVENGHVDAARHPIAGNVVEDVPHVMFPLESVDKINLC